MDQHGIGMLAIDWFTYLYRYLPRSLQIAEGRLNYDHEPVPERLTQLEKWSWVGVYVLMFVLRFAQSSDSMIADEELHTPTVAILLTADFSPSLLPLLQYTPFCGGCSAETMLVWPLFSLFGPWLVLWKIIPLFIGVVILLVGCTLSERAAGRIAARVFAMTLLCGPTWWAVGSSVAFGSHFEMMSLVLPALFVWATMLSVPVQGALLLGVLLGGAVWFCYGAAFVVPVLVSIWILHRLPTPHLLWAEGARMAIGMSLGMLPWMLTQGVLRQIGFLESDSWFSVYNYSVWTLLGDVPFAQRINELLGLPQWLSMWAPILNTEQSIPGAAAVLACVVAVALTVWMGVWKWQTDRTLGALLLAIGLAPLSYALCYVLLAPAGVPAGSLPFTANDMRYFLPLVPCIALCLGVVTARLWAFGGARAAIAVALLIPTVGSGAVIRLAEIQPQKLHTAGFHRIAIEPDTVIRRCHVLRLDATSLYDLGYLSTTLQQHLSNLPDRQYARSLKLMAIGYHLVGMIAVEESKQTKGLLRTEQILNGLEHLSAVDRQDLFFGMALLMRDLGGWKENTPALDPLDSLSAIFQIMSPKDTLLLSRFILLQDPDATREWNEALTQGISPFPSGSERNWHLAGAWTMGYSISEFSDVDELQRWMDTGSEPLSLALRRSFISGIIHRFCVRSGCDSARLAEIESHTDPRWKEALREGWSIGEHAVNLRTTR